MSLQISDMLVGGCLCVCVCVCARVRACVQVGCAVVVLLGECPGV